MAVFQGMERGLGSILSAVKRNWRLSRGVINSGLHFRNGILTATMRMGDGRTEPGDQLGEFSTRRNKN